MCIAKTMLKRVVSPTLKIQTREINPGALIQNPLRPSLMLRQNPPRFLMMAAHDHFPPQRFL